MAKFIIAVIVLVILMLLFLLVKVNLPAKPAKEKSSSERGSGFWHKKKEVKLVYPPFIGYRLKGEKGYPHDATVTKQVFIIGSAPDCDLVLASDTVEGHHVRITKQIKGDSVSYLIQNLARTNPVEYYDAEDRAYYFMGYRQVMELEKTNIVIIGEVKMKLIIPDQHTKQTITEQLKQKVVDTPAGVPADEDGIPSDTIHMPAKKTKIPL